jgi:hypothetical protein
LLLGGGDQRIRSGQRRDLLFATATRALREDFVTLLPALVPINGCSRPADFAETRASNG